jgi:hypothetical protein
MATAARSASHCCGEASSCAARNALATRRPGEYQSTTASITDSHSKAARVLRRTTAVVAKVDPLLSGADELQQLTGGIESSRNSFSTDANVLVDDLVGLGNALVDAANVSGVDISYLNTDIDNVNYEINNVRSEAANLSSADSRYASASQRFGGSATAFTNAVRALQRELRTLPSK